MVRDVGGRFVRYWATRAEMLLQRLLAWVGVPTSILYAWEERLGKANRHNAKLLRRHWLRSWERRAIRDDQAEHPEVGYWQLTYMMLDADRVAVSPSSVYRVIKNKNRIGIRAAMSQRKGEGFDQPAQAHAHGHIDVSYLNISGTFYYLCSILDGYSRYVVFWEIRESMKEADVETVLQRARERYSEATPRIISDNGPQFMARDSETFIRESGVTPVRTSPYYPQSNGKIERWHGTLKRECIRPKTPLNIEDARRVVERYVRHYNEERLHAGIGYVTPVDRLDGRDEAVWRERHRKLDMARAARREGRHAPRPAVARLVVS